MVSFIAENSVSPGEYLQFSVDELVEAANEMPSGVRFHLRDLVVPAEWQAYTAYWREVDEQVILRLGKEFYNHPRLNARYEGKDSAPGDGAAVYVNG